MLGLVTIYIQVCLLVLDSGKRFMYPEYASESEAIKIEGAKRAEDSRDE